MQSPLRARPTISVGTAARSNAGREEGYLRSSKGDALIYWVHFDDGGKTEGVGTAAGFDAGREEGYLRCQSQGRYSFDGVLAGWVL